MPTDDKLPASKVAPEDAAFGLSSGKKALFAAVVVSGVLAVAELILAVAGVGTIAVTEDPYVGFQSTSPLFVPAENGDASGVVRTAPNKRHIFNDQRFPATKEAGTFRIFCLGGSTTYGRPYDDRTSFAGWLRAFLAAADPSRKWEVINAGGISYASYRVSALMEELNRYAPDLYIIYSGHNEFLERRTYGGIIEEHPAVTAVNLLLYRSRIYAGLVAAKRRLVPERRSAARERYELSGEVRAMLDTTVGLDHYHRDDALASQILDHYRYNLGRMAALARSAGAEILFVTPATNHKDFSPFKNAHRADLTAAELAQWEGLVDRASEAMAGDDPSAAAGALAAAAAIDGRYAQTHYDLGRALLALERYEEAGEAFRRAVVEDVAPLRALPAMRSIVEEVGRRHGVAVVDFVGLLEARSRERSGHAIPGDEDFLDHVHPTIEATGVLAGAILDRMAAEGWVEPSADWGDEKADAIGAALVSTLTERDHAVALRNLAMVLEWAGKLEESARLVDKAREVIPDDVEALVMRGKILLKAGRLDEAIVLFRRSVQVNPSFVWGHVNLGAALARKGEIDLAMQHYRAAIRMDPDIAVPRVNLAKHLVARGRWEEAIDQYRAAVRLEPANADFHNDLGVALGRQDRIDEAMACFARALELAPEDANILQNSGKALARAGRRDEAIDCFRHSLRLRPDHPEPLADLAGVLAEKGDFEEAIRHYRRALARDPDMVGARGALGEHLVERGEFAEAIAVWREGLTRMPQDGSLANALAMLLATCPRRELRDGAEAVRLAEQVNERTRGRHPRVLHTLAAAYAERGDFDRAVRTARQAQALARKAGDSNLAKVIENRARAYQARRNP